MVGNADYDPDVDLDHNGVINGDDTMVAKNLNFNDATISDDLDVYDDDLIGPDNQLGCGGYTYSAESQGFYCVRNRWYDPSQGR